MPYSLTGLIERACRASRFEPNLSVNLEVCELINEKQGTAPRVAAQTIVKFINSIQINQAMLALTLLDNCVKNCGYPFHLQIASKEFLNALVSRFPERPSTRYAPNPIQSAPENQWNSFDYIPSYEQKYMAPPVIDRILYLIKEWKVALAELSRYKDDMIHIKNMYRLLKSKGYQFPEVRESSVAALAPNESLKSARELEEEDNIAKSAKLQELIRRGRPEDLVEANRLMKIMSGYDTKHQTDIKEQFAEELHKIENKARLLYEMLDNLKEGDELDDGGAIYELKSACESSLSKIKSMLNSEEDKERIQDLQDLSTLIGNVVLKFQDIKNGRYNTSYDLSGKHSQTTDGFDDKNSHPQEISLIDLDNMDDFLSPSTSYDSSSTRKNAIEELSDIFGEKITVSSNDSYSNANSSPTDPFDFLSQNLSSRKEVGSPKSTTSPTFSAQNTFTSPVQKAVLKTIDLVNKNGLNIVLDVYKSGQVWELKAFYSNKSTAPMEKMTLLLAAPKSMSLKMGPVSSSSLPPKTDRAVEQSITINNTNKERLRLRYKVTYEQFGVSMEQTGEFYDSQ